MRNLDSNELQHVYGGHKSDYKNSSKSYSKDKHKNKHKHNTSSHSHGKHKDRCY